MSQPTSILRVWTTRQDYDSEEVFLGRPAEGEEPREGTRSHCTMMLTGRTKNSRRMNLTLGMDTQAQVSLPCLEVSHCRPTFLQEGCSHVCLQLRHVSSFFSSQRP